MSAMAVNAVPGFLARENLQRNWFRPYLTAFVYIVFHVSAYVSVSVYFCLYISVSVRVCLPKCVCVCVDVCVCVSMGGCLFGDRGATQAVAARKLLFMESRGLMTLFMESRAITHAKKEG
jgi:hypothetical protein